MNTNTVHLLFASNHSFFAGLAVSVASALDFRAPGRPYAIHILDTGLLNHDREKLSRLVAARPSASIEFHPVDLSPFLSAKEFHGSWDTYARLLMARAIPNDEAIRRLLYLDVDVLVARDLGELYDMPLDGNVAAMGKDNLFPDLSGDCPFDSSDDMKRFPYFNAGILLIDFRKWREENLEEGAIRLALQCFGQLKLCDQTILNYLLRGRIKTLDGAWNRRVRLCGPEDDVIYHYSTVLKPWAVKRYRQIDDLWWLFYERRVKPFHRVRYRWWTRLALLSALYNRLSFLPTSLLERVAARRAPKAFVKIATSLLAFRRSRYDKDGTLSALHDAVRRLTARIDKLPPLP